MLTQSTYEVRKNDNEDFLILKKLDNTTLKTTGIDEKFNSFEDYYANYRKYMKSRQKLRPVKRDDFTSVEGMVQMALEDWSVR